jgi:hypothetical protein
MIPIQRYLAQRRALHTIALAAVPAALVSVAALAPAQAAAAHDAKGRAPAGSTARIQVLLNNPVHGTVNLPRGTFLVRPGLTLPGGERIVGHHTTLKVAPRSGNYLAVLTGATAATDLSGLTITGVTVDQNAAANPIGSVQPLYHGQPRFVILVTAGSGITITRDSFTGSDNVNTIVTGTATRDVLISHDVFRTVNAPVHDHSTVYTSGVATTISDNRFAGTAMQHSAAIEVHGTGATITGNHVHGYYRGANIVCSQTTFRDNKVTGAASPVDLWSVTAPGLHQVRITHNTLGRNLRYWARLLGGLPPPAYTRPVIEDSSSTFPFRQITIVGNRG